MPSTSACSFRVATSGLTFEDGGLAFDPTERDASAAGGALDTATLGGRGILMIRTLARSMRYERRDGRNVLELVIDRKRRLEHLRHGHEPPLTGLPVPQKSDGGRQAVSSPTRVRTTRQRRNARDSAGHRRRRSGMSEMETAARSGVPPGARGTRRNPAGAGDGL